MIAAGEDDRKALDASAKSITDAQTKIDAEKISLDESRAKLKEAITSIDALNAKIADTDRAVKLANQQQRVDDIKNKIADLQKKLDAANAKIKDVEPAFNDLQASYDDLAKVRESNFNGCYKTIFNDDSSEFKQDENDDQIQFDGAETFNRYCQKVFGDAASPKSNIRVVDNVQKADKPADQPANGADK